MNSMHRLIPLLILSTAFYAGLSPAQDVDKEPIREAVERHLTDEPFIQWVQDPERIDTEASDTIELHEVVTDGLETIKLSGLVPPIRFESGVANIPDDTVRSLNEILDRMRDKLNVRLHLVGHADNRPLSPELQKIYGDNAGLSRERAGEVAEHFKASLGLPPEAISYDWAGDTQPVATNDTDEGRALNRRVEVEVWYDEVAEKISLEEFLVPAEIKAVKVCRMETVCKLRYVDGHARRARVKNLVAPLHYDTEAIDIDDAFVTRLRQGFENLSEKQNVVVKFVGYTDDQPLTGRNARIYGDHVGLSKARARRVALAVQDMLDLPSSIIESDGRGAKRPIGSNETPLGRALNRRVEVEFWYDDPLQELPDEPQLCPEDAGAVTVIKTYDPPWGSIANIEFNDGRPVVPPGYTDKLARALRDVAGKTNPRLRFVGYTRNERLNRRTASVYGDDIGLSASRARRVMNRIAADMQLEDRQTEFEGRGYVHSDDVVNSGFFAGDTSHVAVEVVYDDLAILDDYEGVDIKRITREISPENPLALNLMRITVDGEPIDDPKRSSSDIQRCTDVAFEKVDIRFGFDNMSSDPRLSVTAHPPRIAVSSESGEDVPATTVRFKMYTNYSYFIDRAEIRVFHPGQSLEAQPIDVIDIDLDGIAKWKPPLLAFQGATQELAYVLRAYGKDGNFDETEPQSLQVIYNDLDLIEFDEETTDVDDESRLLAAYGENQMAVHNIGLGSGTISVRGTGIPSEHEIWVGGRPVPVDESGRFVAEEILPEGAHTVEVAVVDKEGYGELYLRDLEFKTDDWFYVGMADLTVSANTASGPIDLLQGENAQYDYDSNIDGRLAFFVNGKFGDHWKLTASADTREGPIRDIFTNLMDKSPDALFRRIDPDYYYPTFGDDGTVEELAPTMGKFYVRVARNNDYGLWGNFKAAYMNNELAQVDRGLYGGNVHYESGMTTGFGEQRFAVDAFAAEPGTIPSREEFRGTGGSLYYLQRQDVLAGSERVRIELRDKSSGLVTGVVNLAPAMDYDIDYLQGRILLSEPLAATADDKLLVRSGAVSGDEAYLVVRYEYTPGFDNIDAVAVGGQAHYWFGDWVKIGLTANANEQSGDDSGLAGADLTLRLTPDSWLKLQQAKSEGAVSLPLLSNDGGFGFSSVDPASFANADAKANRIDLSVRFNDIVSLVDGRMTMYVQEADAGYSAPSLTTITDTKAYGGTLSLPIADKFTFDTKIDNRVQEQGIETHVQEYNVGYRYSENWKLSAGLRTDERTDRSTIVPLTQEQGKRTDAVVQVAYDPKSDWKLYAFTQDTLSSSGDRQSNARAGVGGAFRVSEKLKVDGEISSGDLGTGGRIGTNYVYSDRTSLYLNYALDTDRPDNGVLARRGGEGNLVTGIKSRIADSTSVFLEERYQHSKSMTGLTHATGINFAPSDKWTLGFNTDIGTLEDVQTGAETERLAGGIQVAFGHDDLQISSAIEYRNDDSQQLDLTTTERTTWLFKNNGQYQLNPSARLIGKLNHSNSESSLGTFFDGGYTEAVFGYGYRPVHNDRLNALVKYTYFYNVPTTDQAGAQNIAAEFIQKSHIAAVDVTYDITPAITIGGKYAYRLAQVSLDRENPEFFKNNASLYVLRGDYRFWENWELLVEVRMLDMPDINQNRSGALAAVSRYFGDYLKLGIGYNFTDFSADLTDLDFDHHGIFVNLTGAM